MYIVNVNVNIIQLPSPSKRSINAVAYNCVKIIHIAGIKYLVNYQFVQQSEKLICDIFKDEIRVGDTSYMDNKTDNLTTHLMKEKSQIFRFWLFNNSFMRVFFVNV